MILRESANSLLRLLLLLLLDFKCHSPSSAHMDLEDSNNINTNMAT